MIPLPEPLAHWQQFGRGLADSVELGHDDMTLLVKAFQELQAKIEAIKALPTYTEQASFNRNVVPVMGSEKGRWLELAAVERVLG